MSTRERDLRYEEANVGYNVQYTKEDGGGIKCKNYELCNDILPKWWWECKGNYLCMSCDQGSIGFGWKELEFRESPDDGCVICFETINKQVKFPANCGHWFCTPCSRQILFWDESRYHISPVPFGCPPCPKNCTNPIRGQQCGCAEYDEILEKWEHDSPEQHKKWLDSEEMSIESGSFHESVVGSKTCPLCRAVYQPNSF